MKHSIEPNCCIIAVNANPEQLRKLLVFLRLSFKHHIQHLCKTSFYELRNISKLCSSLSLSDAVKLVHAFVSSRVGYCNALLIGKLQYISDQRCQDPDEEA